MPFLETPDGRWRQSYHLAPREGLMNDPNGLIAWNGDFHVFFQWNPTGCTHSNKSWGHVRSRDLVHWEELPIALSPTDTFDSHGCYSGSAVADGDDLVLFYTGNVRDGLGERQTHQCLARSADGEAFEKFGPVLSGPAPGYTAHFRDPKVWRAGEGWRMVLGAQTTGLRGHVLLLRSPDLLDWTVVGPILDLGDDGYMCECPDLFRLEGLDVLTVCRQSRNADGSSSDVAGWVAGVFDDRAGTFDHGPFERLDQGPDLYAPQTLATPDGRRLLIGWMGLPQQQTAPTVADGWLHCLTLPRELTWENGRLCQTPARELQALRKSRQSVDHVTVEGSLALPGVGGEIYEIDLALPPQTATWHLDLRASAAGATRIGYDGETTTLSLADVDAEGAARPRGVAIFLPGGPRRLRIFVDRSSIEVFVDRGEHVFTARIYPPDGAEQIRFHATAAMVLERLDFWTM